MPFYATKQDAASFFLFPVISEQYNERPICYRCCVPGYLRPPRTGSGAEIKLPVGVEEYLERFPDTDMVYIHFDNDEPGRTAGERLRAALQDRQIESVLQYPPMGCKDVNDYLVAVREHDAKKEAEKQAEAGL